MNKILEVLETWPKTIYLQHWCYEDAPEYPNSHKKLITWGEEKEFPADIEYIRADLVKVKTEDEIKEIICKMLRYDNIQDVEGVYLANAIFDALKNAGLHCK